MVADWTCHVCGDLRPDARIGVRTEVEHLPGDVVVRHNVRYCNDREACVLRSYEAARERRLRK